MGPGLDRPLRYAEPPCCLRHRGSTVIALEQYLPVLDRELHQRGSDDRGVGGAVGRVGDLQLRRIGGDDLTPATRRAPVVDDDAPGHGEQPRARRAVRLVKDLWMLP